MRTLKVRSVQKQDEAFNNKILCTHFVKHSPYMRKPILVCIQNLPFGCHRRSKTKIRFFTFLHLTQKNSTFELLKLNRYYFFLFFSDSAQQNNIILRPFTIISILGSRKTRSFLGKIWDFWAHA